MELLLVLYVGDNRMNISNSKVAESALGKFLRSYRAVAVFVLNVLVLGVAFNIVLLGFFAIGDAISVKKAPPDPTTKYSESAIAAVYPDLSRKEREDMLWETWSRNAIFDDYVMFKERSFTGKYINISEAGFRHSKDQGPWPPDPQNLNVFVFGGSTTFGYGLPDWQTVPSFLQEGLSGQVKKRTSIYNFGVGWYYSTQERILFEKLLSKGHVPHIAIFIDGVNDCLRRPNDKPHYSEEFDKAFALDNERILSVGDKVPMMRAARHVRRWIQNAQMNMAASRPSPEPDKKVLRAALERYLKNKAIIQGVCRQFSILPVFVWQPAPGYEYDLKNDPFANLPQHKKECYCYQEMARIQRCSRPTIAFSGARTFSGS